MHLSPMKFAALTVIFLFSSICFGQGGFIDTGNDFSLEEEINRRITVYTEKEEIEKAKVPMVLQEIAAEMAKEEGIELYRRPIKTKNVRKFGTVELVKNEKE